MINKSLKILLVLMLFTITGCNSNTIKDGIKDNLLINEEGLIFSITMGNKGCIPVQLSVYQNGIYKFHTAYKTAKESEIQTDILIYSEPIVGTYDYDVLQIIKNSVDANNLSYDMDNLPEYEIYTGKGHYYTTDSNNVNLMEFLESINIELKECAAKEYY